MVLYYRKEFDFDEFNFWSGARDRIESATEEQKEQVKQRIKETFFYSAEETEPTETEINDFVWFECDDIFEEKDEDEDED